MALTLNDEIIRAELNIFDIDLAHPSVSYVAALIILFYFAPISRTKSERETTLIKTLR